MQSAKSVGRKTVTRRNVQWQV